MRMKTPVLVILVGFCFKTVSSDDGSSCYVKTSVNAKAHCRTGGNECNTVSLKKDFPHLFNLSYNSDYPEEIYLTTFCQAKEGETASYPGLQYQFTPPGHNGVTSIQGFEVRLEGGPPSLSDFKCTIIELEDYLTLNDVSVTFSSRFYPVSRKTPYVVVVSSLPRKDSSYRNEKKITSKTCDTQVTSAAWKPSYFNVSYDSNSEILGISFETPPEKFKFDRFSVILVDKRTFRHVYSDTISKTDLSISGVKPGEYEIRVEPDNPFWTNEKLCKCRNSAGRCGGCTETIKNYVATVTKTSTSKAKTSKTDSALEAKDASSGNKEVITAVFIPVLCVFTLVCGVIGIVVFRRCRKYNSSGDKDCSTHNAELIKHKTVSGVLIVYDENSKFQNQIAEKLRNILHCVFAHKVKLQVEQFNTSTEADYTYVKVYMTEPKLTANFLSLLTHVQEDAEQSQDIGEDEANKLLTTNTVLISFDTNNDEDEIKDNKVPHFQLMYKFSNFLKHINAFLQIDDKIINDNTMSESYKTLFEELEGLIYDLNQDIDKERKLVSKFPCSGNICHGEVPKQMRCVSNTNSEPDSGIRSGDEFESLTSSEEAMNESSNACKLDASWNSIGNKNEQQTNLRNVYKFKPNNQISDTAGRRFQATRTVKKDKVNDSVPEFLRCPSEIQFHSPEPTEYSEYGEDVFFEDTENDSLCELRCPMIVYSHDTQMCAPNSMAYHRLYPYEKVMCVPTRSKRGRHKHGYQNSNQMQSSVESLMDQMAGINARYQNCMENGDIQSEI